MSWAKLHLKAIEVFLANDVSRNMILLAHFTVKSKITLHSFDYKPDTHTQIF